MIISKTPYRISLFGGGTDYPQWYKEHGGAVIGMSIDKYCYISVRYLPPVFDHKHRIVYSRIETVEDVASIEHPAVRAVLQTLGIEDGLDIHYNGDLPARSGLGSSSSFTVGLLHALHALRGEMMSKRQLAESAIHIEQNVVGENVGSQDQIWAAYGGLNRITFLPEDGFTVEPIIIPMARQCELQDHLMVFFTGISRNASEIAKHKIANLGSRERQLHEMRSIVDTAQDILTTPSRSLAEMGELLDASWKLKRELASPISSDTIDSIYAAGIAAGAYGGKLLGAGGGGFMIFLAPPEKQNKVRAALSSLIEVKVSIDISGSNILVYNP